MKITQVKDKVDLSQFVHELAGMTYENQNMLSKAITQPKDYAERTVEGVVASNPDLIESAINKYVKAAESAPVQCHDALKVVLADEVLDIVWRRL